ncbi:MAG: hypothetical protein WA799_04460 [Nitrosotalea sp.]
MDKKHYEAYLRIIEPNIESMLDDYLKGWQNIESTINRIFWRAKGAYKTDSDFLLAQGDNIKEYEEYIEIPIYKEFRKTRFSDKIKFLHEKGILHNSIFELVSFLNKRRNRIHGFGTAFSEIERQAFSLTDSMLLSVYIANSPNSGIEQDAKNTMLHDIENKSLRLLNELKNILSTKKSWE